MGEQIFNTPAAGSRDLALPLPAPIDWLATLLAIDAALARVSTNAEAARAVIELVGEAGGWAAVNLYRIDDALGELRVEAHWAPACAPVPELEAISRRTWFPCGEGLPGDAWARAGVRWIPDLAAHPAFHRGYWAARDGLRSACAFPVIAGAEILGVIELFARAPCSPDEVAANEIRHRARLARARRRPAGLGQRLAPRSGVLARARRRPRPIARARARARGRGRGRGRGARQRPRSG